jgi:single-strand DNA-binding protein
MCRWRRAKLGNRYTTEIIADNMQMLDSKGNAGGTSSPYEKPLAVNATPEAAPSLDNFDDDIPF